MSQTSTHKTLPRSVFVGFSSENDRISITTIVEDDIRTREVDCTGKDKDLMLFSLLEEHQASFQEKIVGAGIAEANNPKQLGERIWLELDIVPYLHRGTGESLEERSQTIAKKIFEDYVIVDGLDINKIVITNNYKVEPSFLTTFEAYKYDSPESDIEMLLKEVQRFKSLRGNLLLINSTAQGGGVALMRHALIRLFDLLGVDASWCILKSDPEIFTITKKKFHNILQGVADSKLVLSQKDMAFYDAWIEENAQILEYPIKEANVIVIDDTQPSGLIPHIKKINPEAKILFRSHIQIDTSLLKDPASPQNVTWNFLWEKNRVKDADLFISHPIENFIPSSVPKERSILMPATTDPLDGLNKHLTDKQLRYYLMLFNMFLANDGQPPLDTTRPYIVQIARFDPSKGIPDVLESFRALREMYREQNIQNLPQLVIAGHGSVDDPEGQPILEQTKFTLNSDLYKSIASDIKVARLPHNDQILNALMQGCRFALQLSHKEGLEVKVSEALHMGKPIIIYRAGGMPLQVQDGMNGFIIESGQTHQVAEHMYSLLTDNQLYTKMSANARSMVGQDFFTVRNTLKWLWLANEMLEKGSVTGDGKNINDLIGL